MAGEIQRVAMVSMHTSPAEQPGTADSGGLNVSILGLAAELSIRGVEVDLITRARGVATTTELLPGVTLLEFPAGPLGRIDKSGLAAVTDEFGEALAALARRVPGGYDIIHAHYWLSGIAGLPVALELGIPLVQNFHTVEVMKAAAMASAGGEPTIRARSEVFIGRQADAVIAGSSAEATVLIDEVGVPANRTWIIPPGVDLRLFAPRPEHVQAALRSVLKLESERPLLVLAGRVQPLKGHELAIRALAEVKSLREVRPVLVIAGESPPGDEHFEADMRALAAELGVGPDVRFVGALGREVLAELFAAASLTLMPSFSETFGLVALESAASGSPVIGYRGDGLVESIDDGFSGVLIDSRDPQHWAAVIGGMLDNDERRSAMGLSARAHAEKFTWAAAAASLLGVYAGLGKPAA